VLPYWAEMVADAELETELVVTVKVVLDWPADTVVLGGLGT
jgi:hypothetical protein